MEQRRTIRDHLARDRTHLANERTLLAYWRTALAFLILGAGLIKFFPTMYIIIAAILALVFGVVLFIYGTLRYFNYRKDIEKR